MDVAQYELDLAARAATYYEMIEEYDDGNQREIY